MTDEFGGHDIEAAWHSDGGVTLSHQGQTHTFGGRDSALRFVRDVARTARVGRSLRVQTVDGSGPASLVVSPEGFFYDESRPGVRESIPDARTFPPPVQLDVDRVERVEPAPERVEGLRAAPTGDRPERLPSAEPYTGRRRRESFVDDTPPELAPTHGWRGAVAKLGLKVEPSIAERGERADQEIVSQHWPGPRTIAVVNAKGGSGKTPTTICLSATFAKWGGIGVLAWDNNQTRGTLGWRTERGQHDATTLDLIGQTERLTGPNAQMADLAHFVHHQKRDRFDVLRSQPLVLASEQRLTPREVQSIHDVAARYYRLIVIDSGNDESDPIWREMIKHTDQLVVATTTRDDHAEAGALLLEALEAQGGQQARLAAGSVVVINQADVKATHDDLARVRSGFAPLCREAVTVRYDAGMVDGALRLHGLKPTTQRDWLRATAAVARGL